MALAAATAAAGLTSPVSPAQAPVRRLRIAPARQALVGDGNPVTPVWAYNGTVPGPTLRARQGDRLRVKVENALEEGTTVHWHGVRVPNAMDALFIAEKCSQW